MNRRQHIRELTLLEEKMISSYKPAEEIKDNKLIVPADVIKLFREKLDEHNLFIENDDVLVEIVTGVIKGNVILQGPPGTGKTAISKVICETFNTIPITITAIDDWTTYDTIGGLFPMAQNGREVIVGRNGQIVESIVECCNTIIDREIKTEESSRDGKEQAAWLIIDELNRAEIDKVFGDLFTVLGSSDSQANKRINLWFHENPDKQHLVVPNRYRIIGLMNNVDKNYVYDLSQALSRRFTFVTIQPPSIGVVDKELEVVKNSLPKRIISKMNEIGGKTIDEDVITKIMDDTEFAKYEAILVKLLKHVRYENGENEGDTNGYLGLQLGTAQIKDLYETIIIHLLVTDYLNEANKEAIIKKVFDNSFAANIVSQIAGHSYDKKCDFIDYFVEENEYEWMSKTKLLLEEAKLR